MKPSRCKHEHEIPGAIGRWEERYQDVQKDDKELELPDSWKMSALHAILCGEIQKNVEYREKDFKTYEELRSTVMRWAINKKIEKERSTRGDPMDTNQAEEQSAGDDWSWWDQEWTHEEIEEQGQKTLTSSSQKEKAKAKGIATIAGSQVIERSSALIRRKRKEVEKEDRHRREKEKESPRWC